MLDQQENVGLKVYNINGQRIEILVNGNQPAGRYSVQWNADKFPSGVYFYELVTGKGKASKKMNVVK